MFVMELLLGELKIRLHPLSQSPVTANSIWFDSHNCRLAQIGTKPGMLIMRFIKVQII